MKKSTCFYYAMLGLAVASAAYDLEFFLQNIAGWAAIFTPGPAVAQISGSIGGTTFSHNKGGAYMRNRAIPTNPSSEAQLARRATLQTLSSAFQDLTSAQRKDWVEWARQNPGTNALGASFNMTGHQAYIKLNSKVVLSGNTAIVSPPITTAPGAFATIVQAGDIGTGNTDLTFTAALEAGNQVELWAAITNSPAITYVNNLYRFISFSAVDEASPWDNQSDIEGVLGALVVGQTLHVKAAQFDPANGQSSEFLRTSVVITDTV